MGKQNSFEIEILADGTLKVSTASFAGPVHIAADKLMAFLAENLDQGTRLGVAHSHEHAHDHVHAGGGSEHKH